MLEHLTDRPVLHRGPHGERPPEARVCGLWASTAPFALAVTSGASFAVTWDRVRTAVWRHALAYRPDRTGD